VMIASLATSLAVPPHATASPALRHALHVVGQSCFNETIASAVLEASLAAASGALATTALRELLSDEVNHARLGWSYLASAPPELRAKITAWLPALARGNLKMWRQTPRSYATSPEMIAHGALSAETMEQTLLGAFRDLIIPGFERLQMSTGDIAAWVQRGAPEPRAKASGL
jgi:hypothetical protein